jgi:hypothetical protein
MGRVDAWAGAALSGMIWPQALQRAVAAPAGNLAGLTAYFFWQFGQVIFIAGQAFKGSAVQGSMSWIIAHTLNGFKFFRGCVHQGEMRS